VSGVYDMYVIDMPWIRVMGEEELINQLAMGKDALNLLCSQHSMLLQHHGTNVGQGIAILGLSGIEIGIHFKRSVLISGSPYNKLAFFLSVGPKL